MVCVLMCEQDRCHLFRSVSERFKRLHVAAYILSGKSKAAFIRILLRSSRRKTGIHQDDFVTGIDEIILQASAVTDGRIELSGTFFASEREIRSRCAGWEAAMTR